MLIHSIVWPVERSSRWAPPEKPSIPGSEAIFAHWKPQCPVRPKAAAQRVMAFETALAKASRKLEDLRDPEKNYNKLTPAEQVGV